MNKQSPTIPITKASGIQEPFSLEKYKRSLQRAHIPAARIEQVIDQIVPRLHVGMSTKQLYRQTYQLLKKLSPGGASRYSLKEALRLLGPTGFPFERLVAHILEQEGYRTVVDQTLHGSCIAHEVDIVATSQNGKKMMVECKFHNQYGLYTDVHTTLYVKARFDDIHAVAKNIAKGMVATNTKFSNDAINYGSCVGLELLAWGYPVNDGIERKIETYQLFPITAFRIATTRGAECPA